MSVHDTRLARRKAEEAARIAAVKARGRVPEQCGPDIPEAPARGAFRLVQLRRLYPDGAEGYRVKDAGHLGRAAICNADVFDRMAASAARARKPVPLSPGQIAMGRHYRDLVERHACAGLRCSSIEAVRSGGSGQGGGFMDAVLRDREEIAWLHRRIGAGVAMAVRRVRPSARGTRVAIPDRQLVDLVCLEDQALSDVLRAYGWSVYGDTLRGLTGALAAALDRMTGPAGCRAIVTMRTKGD
ncbi:hypothetical protein [Pseudodonghicola flavimaris]|uniref:Uncharacterized protein n=1 Tax=Pseudodonghicola flavimaris TaxID=3050036 RepID=A0ABT7EZ54_9RHOB|nr:hypothetical protein [Pseudodonghicola flavimaris]MDK3017613.1 hypothetical protein [Pseudodonghicola flavimaris]